MKSMKMLLGGAALLLAASGSLQAQSVQAIAIGSSALTLALGEATSASTTAGGVGATCIWSGSSVVQATDPTIVAPATVDNETGTVWIAWTPGTRGSCTSVSTTTQVYSYLQTDSVVGDRCLFNGCTISPVKAGVDPTNTATANLVLATGEQTNVPAAVWNAINGQAVTVAGTDIRPEDAQFAINRALTACNTAVSSSSYRGLGYSNGDAFASDVSTATFRVVNFNINSSPFTVTTVGAAPVMVAAVGSNFSTINNLSSDDLALFLSGSYTATNAKDATVLVREALSGTYNTMEYNVPNTTTRFRSQDVGVNNNTPDQNCNGQVPHNKAVTSNGITTYLLAQPTDGQGIRKRVIGTGESLKTLFNSTSDTLGYAFWSTANFKGASATSHYVTIDNVDPVLDTFVDGTIPTPSNGKLSNVTLSNVANGTYPIWSKIRLVNLGSTASAGVTAMANAAQTFIPATAQPDFVKAANLTVVRSHFTPPGVTTTPNNGGTCGAEEGGDVGGVVLTIGSGTECNTGERK